MEYIVLQMSRERLSSKVQTRVSDDSKSKLEQIANGRHLDTADVVREAIREYIERHPVDQPLLPHLKEEVAA